MARRPYDPVKRHEYYMRTRELVGKHAGVKISKSKAQPKNKPPKPKESHLSRKETKRRALAKVGRLKEKISKLEVELTKVNARLAEARRNAAKTEKKNSDGKSTAKEKKESREYRDKHKTELETKEKKESKKSSSSKSSSKSSSGSSSSSSSAESSVEDLEYRARQIKRTLSSARSQLNKTVNSLKQLSHSSMQDGVSFISEISRKDSVKMTVADFTGYATRNNLRCSDGRTILADAFKDNHDQVVPLLWQHGHDEPENVLGHVRLENVADGVRAHAYFNNTAKGQHAKEMVRHGDVKFLSIFANNLVENAKAGLSHLKDVVKGNIREVSLVIAGANPGAVIDNVALAHNDGSVEVFTEEAIITTGLEIELTHADTDVAEDDEKTLEDVLDTLNEEQRTAVDYILSQALLAEDEDDSVKHSDEGEESEESQEDAEESSEDSEDSEDSKDEESSEEGQDDSSDETENTDKEADEAVQHDDTQEDNSMTHNVFDQSKTDSAGGPQTKLSHSDVEGIVASAMEIGSLKKAVQSYALQHNIRNIDVLFPDAKTIENSPAFISRRMEWVDKVLNAVRKSPFARIKTISADITPDQARARGYIKGNLKNEEYFEMAKRETTPQTIYKKQKLDRDDVVDIVDLDVVAWLKAEMRVMLDEEIAGAILVGDGRSVGDDDKIKEINIRPIASDSELYVTTAYVNLDDANSSVEELVDSVIENRQYYKGSGQPTFYTTEGIISKFLTVKDNFGRRIYNSIAEVAAVLRVSDVVAVEVMERVPDVVGIMVNLSDYTLGADKGGQVTMFDDFDIDYNKLRYLIETRLSGALTQPKSAVVFRKTAGSAVLAVPVPPAFEDNEITVPTVTGVVYKNAGGSTLTTGSPVEVTAVNSPYKVFATPASGYYFANNVDDEWVFTYQA